MTGQQCAILSALQSAPLTGLTPHELMAASGGVIGYRQRVTELRRLGYVIEVFYEGRTKKGSSLFRYRLVAGHKEESRAQLEARQ